jgi:hypothetical protein
VEILAAGRTAGKTDEQFNDNPGGYPDPTDHEADPFRYGQECKEDHYRQKGGYYPEEETPQKAQSPEIGLINSIIGSRHRHPFPAL